MPSFDYGAAKKLAGVKASASGWFQGTDFNLDASGTLQLPVFGTIGATGVFSSAGYAFCGQYHFISAGIATDNWLVAPDAISGCDFTPYRVPPPPAQVTRAATAAGARTVAVRAGQRGVAIRLRATGAGAAPRVRLLAPDGRAFSTPEGASALTTRGVLIVPVDQLATTTVFLRRPHAGRWRVEPLTGSPAITHLDTASQLDPPRIRGTARVTQGRVTVAWRTHAQPGQRIELHDLAAGSVTRIHRATAKDAGHLTFTPPPPRAGKHTIEALVIQNGRPLRRVVLARYHMPPPPRPGTVKIKARRTKTSLTLTWRRPPHAAGYLLTITQGPTVITRALLPAARTTATLPDPPAGDLTVRIQAQDTSGRTGKATTLTSR